MNAAANYTVPQGPLKLSGPVSRPAPGTLPLRPDLAHIALAGRYLVSHYVIPHQRRIGALEAVLRLAPGEQSAQVARLAAGTAVELLDLAGNWAWVCLGPDGPSGHVRLDQLAPEG